MKEVVIDGGFIPGLNRLEIVVKNTVAKTGMGVCVQLSGTGVRRP